jgi:DNA-binding CsgD family transcriptional regulator/signal transduction histidine kinase
MDDDLLAQERARLAAQLRAALIEPLALLAAQTTAFEQAAGQDERQRAAFAMVAALARQALQRARDMEADLDDARLGQLGLEACLDLLCGRAMRSSPASVELSLPRLRGDLPPAAALALLRFAQDALARATGPAYARRVRLRLSRDASRAELSIADDGDPEAGADLIGVAEGRIVRLGGSVSRLRAAHGGLELAATLPLLPAAVLTPREREVLTMLVAGRTTRAIAAQTSMAPRTVTFHLANIYAKLGVAGRAEAIIAALRDNTLWRQA